ncbi:hypothetical protein ACSBR2_030620 [Camellia fascicularis]
MTNQAKNLCLFATFLLVSLLVLLPFCNAQPLPNSQAEALLKWKQSIANQSILTSWAIKTNLSSSSHCKWLGVACNNAGDVIGLNLAYTGLKGTLERLDFSSFPQLLRLDLKYCIGVGGSARVYKAKLPSGQVVAVKKLSTTTETMEIEDRKSFMNEIAMLIEIRHRNIVKLYGYCSHERHTFLVYEFLERGSLANVLSSDKEAKEFDWFKRVEVIRSVAHALYYMHHSCMPPIIHRDISSKNVLLNLKLEAHISDFGTARFLKPYSLRWTSVAGTYGYIAQGDFNKFIKMTSVPSISEI